MRVSGETRVVSMARAQHEEPEDEDGEEQTAPESGDTAEETAEE